MKNMSMWVIIFLFLFFFSCTHQQGLLVTDLQECKGEAYKPCKQRIENKKHCFAFNLFPLKHEKVEFEGKCQNGVPFAHGTMKWYLNNQLKSIEKGWWKDGKLQGKVSVSFVSGAKYNGFVKDGKKDGFGESVYSYGTYKGEYKNNFEEGKGEMRWNNGNTYTGIFHDGQMKSGKTISPNGVVCEKHYQQATKMSKGRCSYPSGIIYEGSFHKGGWSGEGVLIIPQIGEIKGRWKKNELIEISQDKKTIKSLLVYTIGKHHFGKKETDEMVNKIRSGSKNMDDILNKFHAFLNKELKKDKGEKGKR